MVEQADGGLRLDQYLVQRQPQTRSQLKRLIDLGHCTVNGEPARAARRLRAGDRVELEVPPPEPDTAIAERIPLTVYHEDDHLVVVEKPAGMVVHPAAGHSHGTLVNALLGHCHSLSGIGGTLRPGIVHRLDRLTSGVMVVSKSDAAHLGLAEQFARHTVERSYVAVVAGTLRRREGTFDTFHGRHPVDRKRFTSRGDRGRRAVTHYRVTRELVGASVVQATLSTGRTHQVRVHFADAGHPVLGDPMYGRPARDRTARAAAAELGRQALHAQVLGFSHPVTGEVLRFVSPLPADIRLLLQRLGCDEQEES